MACRRRASSRPCSGGHFLVDQTEARQTSPIVASLGIVEGRDVCMDPVHNAIRRQDPHPSETVPPPLTVLSLVM